MCSIIGYYGKESAAPILVKGLKRMEYRGYDSVGVATKSDHKIEIRKGVGKVTEVNDSENLDKLPGSIGIGHTRWATHGKVTKVNAHPHPSNSGKVVIVHNGIIENFNELKEDLQKNGFTFISETDTEVIVNLLQQNYDQTSDVKKAKIKIEAIISSELSTLPDSIEPNSIFIAVSQSGESADVLEAVNIAKKSNAKILSIANHKN